MKKTGFVAILEDMLLRLSQRNVVREIHKIIWKSEDPNAQRYQWHGILEHELLDLFIRTQYWRVKRLEKFLLWAIDLFDKQFDKIYTAKVKGLIQDSIIDGYLEKDERGNIRVRAKGDAFISKWWWVKEFTHNPLILKLIEFGFPTGGAIIIAKEIINATK